MKRLAITVLAAAWLLSGCADPEQSAQKSLDAAKADWDEAQASLDPQKRVKAYQSAIEDVEGITSKYQETQIGAALAAGRAVGGLSLTSMKSEHDRLAERAACYAAPTAECLLPFASRGFRHNAAGTGEDAAQLAIQLVCKQDFARAEAALESLKINPPVYAANLLQVAMQAAQCNKPDEARAAVTAYMAAEPAQGANRITQLMTILHTDQLRPAWADVLAVVEKEAPSAGLDPGTVAGIDLTLATIYADAGNADTALAKFKHVTEELAYSVDINTRRELASALIAGGNAAAGMEILSKENVQNISLIALRGAAATVGGRLGVIRPDGAATASVPYTGDLTEYFAPVDSAKQKTESVIAGQIETELDKFVAPLKPTGEWLGMSGAETIYGMLALIQQKLGAPDKASALSKKAEETRAALSRPGSYNAESQSYLAEFQLLVALGQGDTDQATTLLSRVIPVGNDDAKLIFVALARKGEAEKALTLASRINRASGQTYELVINELGAHGHAQKAEAVLNAFPGDASVRSAMAWSLVEKAAQGGDLKTAEGIAEKYSLLNTPAYRLRMTALKAEAAVARDDRGEAEAAMREMFSIGDEIDKASAQNRTPGYYAQNAATLAFKAGYADLGIELYRAASSKDQRPFFAAFEENARPSEFPSILMTAHDNLRDEELGYVIDSAIRRLDQ